MRRGAQTTSSSSAVSMGCSQSPTCATSCLPRAIWCWVSVMSIWAHPSRCRSIRAIVVTTKYNPARTWTPPNVVGIGGAYLCIYGMEGPGGYQLFGRTIQVWNSYRQDAQPWLLRFFDQIRFFPVTHSELTEWRRDFP